MVESNLSDSKNPSADEFRGFIQSSGENHVGSNPTAGCFGYTHGGENPTPGANSFRLS